MMMMMMINFINVSRPHSLGKSHTNLGTQLGTQLIKKLCCIIDALPAEWRRFLRTYNYSDIEPFNLQNQTQLQSNGQNVLISKAVSKTIYKELRNTIITPPTAQLKYNALFKNDDELNWEKIYRLPHRVALDTKSREFQYKLP